LISSAISRRSRPLPANLESNRGRGPGRLRGPGRHSEATRPLRWRRLEKEQAERPQITMVRHGLAIFDALGSSNLCRSACFCPGDGIDCGRRVAKLHLSRRLFLCRCCSQLHYASQYETPGQRAVRRAKQIEATTGHGCRDGRVVSR
jgi:hypothetical protein